MLALMALVWVGMLGVYVADFSGMQPILPTGGQYSQRQVSKDGQSDYNLFRADPTHTKYFDSTAGGVFGSGRERQIDTPGGYYYGFGDPSAPGADKNYRFSQNIFPYMLPSKIVPSQFTQTPEQTVGPAQFFMNGQSSVSGQPQPQQGFQAGPGDSRQEQAPAADGFTFGGQFMPGQFSSQTGPTTFYSQQPNQSSNPLLGQFQPWNPNLNALQQSR